MKARTRFALIVGFTVSVAFGALAVPLPAGAQQAGKVARIGILCVGICPLIPLGVGPNDAAFVQGLREAGYTDGRNLSVDVRGIGGSYDQLPALVAGLVQSKVDVIVAIGSPASAQAAKNATSTIPIVMVGVLEPVRRGLVPNLAHPGGNVTGLTDTLMETEGKRLQLLKEAVPKISRVALLYAPGSPEPLLMREREAAAQTLGLTLQVYRVREPSEFAGAFTAMTTARAEALFVVPNPFWDGHEQRIVDLAAQSHLPAIYQTRDFVKAGGLMAYGVNFLDLFRRTATFVDKILKGAKPGDLPVEQPTKFELVVNLKAAKALGLTIPQSILLRADEVIQ